MSVHPRRFLYSHIAWQHVSLVGRLWFFAKCTASDRFDDIGCVVDDNVEVHAHVQRMRAIDKLSHIFLCPKMRIDAGEVDTPVSVVRGARIMHGSLNDKWCYPDSGETKVTESLQSSLWIGALTGESLEIASVIKPGIGRIEAGVVAHSGQSAQVVRLVTICVSVRHHEINDPGCEVAVVNRRGQGLELAKFWFVRSA